EEGDAETIGAASAPAAGAARPALDHVARDRTVDEDQVCPVREDGSSLHVAPRPAVAAVAAGLAVGSRLVSAYPRPALLAGPPLGTDQLPAAQDEIFQDQSGAGSHVQQTKVRGPRRVAPLQERAVALDGQVGGGNRRQPGGTVGVMVDAG